jgi:hypothetical protein
VASFPCLSLPLSRVRRCRSRLMPACKLIYGAQKQCIRRAVAGHPFASALLPPPDFAYGGDGQVEIISAERTLDSEKPTFVLHKLPCFINGSYFVHQSCMLLRQWVRHVKKAGAAMRLTWAPEPPSTDLPLRTWRQQGQLELGLRRVATMRQEPHPMRDQHLCTHARSMRG